MAILDRVKPLANKRRHGSLWVVYGKSGSGKTSFLSTFPKPLLYCQFGDDGSNSMPTDMPDVGFVTLSTFQDILDVASELESDKRYKSVAIDTFSLCVNEWIEANITQKNKKMTQQVWGDIKTDVEHLIRSLQKLSLRRHIILTCHEVTDVIEDMETAISPDIRPSLNRGSRTYLESMANYGVHMVVVEKEVDKKDGTTATVYRHTAQIMPNPYYWTKVQKPPGLKLPESIYSPTFDKIQGYLQGGTENGESKG